MDGAQVPYKVVGLWGNVIFVDKIRRGFYNFLDGLDLNL